MKDIFGIFLQGILPALRKTRCIEILPRHVVAPFTDHCLKLFNQLAAHTLPSAVLSFHKPEITLAERREKSKSSDSNIGYHCMIRELFFWNLWHLKFSKPKHIFLRLVPPFFFTFQIYCEAMEPHSFVSAQLLETLQDQPWLVEALSSVNHPCILCYMP